MRKGFTLLETIFAGSVMAVVVVVATSGWITFMVKADRANNQSMLDMDARKVVERFRAEMRNSSRGTVIFYPENEAPYKAVGFALASDSDGDGLMDMDPTGSNILWRQTVVYHVYVHEPTQMRRTVFSNRNNAVSSGAYYAQVASVVAAGNGEGSCLAGETSQTSVMFENLFSGKLWHADAVNDTYAAEPNTLERLTFGNLSLGPGAHTVTFTVAGKNPNSSGRMFRLDQLSASVSGWPLEAEMCAVTSAVSVAPAFVGVGLSGAAYGLEARTSSDGQTVSLTVQNDMIEECGFIGKGRNVSMSNTVVKFDATYRPTGFPQGVFATGLDGQYAVAWLGGEQTGDGVRSEYYGPTNCAMRIPVMGPWVVKDGYGPVLRFYKSLYNGNLRLLSPGFAIVETPDDITTLGPDVPTGEFTPLLFYQDGVAKADWAACTAQKYVELRPAQTVPITSDTTILVSFQVGVTTYGSDRFTVLDVKRPSPAGCWIIPGGTAATARQGVWSTESRLQSLGKLPSLEAMSFGFADSGDYVSHPFDTRSEAGSAKTLKWDAVVPSGASLAMYARSGNVCTNGFDIADAPAWSSVAAVANGGAIVGGTGRYVQFRSVFQSAPFSAYPGLVGSAIGPYRNAAPQLRRVCVLWNGEAKYVAVTGNLLKGPDGGMVRVDVDGKPLIHGVTMEIEIFKDVRTMGGVKKERLRSAMVTEVEPRNSDK